MLIDIRSRKRLPHWRTPGATYFVTFRLADSLPAHIRRFKDAEAALDRGRGACYLKRPELADLVAASLQHFEGERYRLHAWCVMPNHVHAVVEPIDHHDLSSIVHSWKSYSAKQANRLLGREGTFWQREYYDYLVRDQGELARAVAYIAMNPIKAGLREWRWVWPGADAVQLEV